MRGEPLSAMHSAIENAKAVGEILNAYIAIHNDIFRFRWRRLIPFGRWFEGIDFHGHLVSLKSKKNWKRFNPRSRGTAMELADSPRHYFLIAKH